MAKAKKRAGRSGGVKKAWYSIIAPKLFNEQIIGEIFVANPASAVGRMVPINLMNLLGDMRRQNTNMLFKIDRITENKLYTRVVGYEMLPSSIKRIVKRAKKKIDYCFSTVTEDGYQVKLKIVMITKNSTTALTLTDLRKSCKETLVRVLGKMPYGMLLEELVQYRMQLKLKKSLSRVYPLRACEIRSMRIEKIGKALVKPSVQKEPVPKAPVKEELAVQASA